MKIDKGINWPESLLVDASVAVKWFSWEEGAEMADRLFKEIKQGRITCSAPNLIVYEIGNALWKGKHFDEERINVALDEIFNSPLVLLALEGNITSIAVNFMVTYDLSFYDSVYAALAFFLGIPLLTANPGHHAKVKEIKILSLK